MKGIVLVIKRDELHTRVLEVSEAHDVCAMRKTEELPQLKEAWERVKRNMGGKEDAVLLANYTTQRHGESPVETLEHEIRQHKRRARELCFIADHLANESYELTLDECKKLQLYHEVR